MSQLATKWVYDFGGGASDGDASMKNLLGGKGRGLFDMTRAGLPVPSGFTLSTEVCKEFVKAGNKIPKAAWDQALAAVVATLRSRWLPGVAAPGVSSREQGFVAELRDAIEKRRRVRIDYERVWQPGVISRVIEPFALERTRRGFEVDAGLVGEAGSVRTYLVPFIRRLQVLDEEFERPVDAVALCRAHRSTTRVLIVVPRDREWVVELLAERVAPLDAVAANVMFLNIYDDGQAYTESEYRGWLADAGLGDIQRRELAGGYVHTEELLEGLADPEPATGPGLIARA